MKRYVVLMMAMLLFLFAGSALSAVCAQEVPSDEGIIYPENEEKLTEEPSCTAKVLKIISDEREEKEFADGFIPVRRIYMTVEVLSGPRKGQVLEVLQEIQPNDEKGLNDIRACKAGDKITVYFSVDEYGVLQAGTMIDFIRTNTITAVAVIFALCLLLFCGAKGIKSVGALLITCVMVLFFMIPAIYDGGMYMPTFSGIRKIHVFSHGVDPVLASVTTSVLIIIITLLVVYGLTHKTLAAAIGATGGAVVAGILSTIMMEAMKLTGIMDEESKSLVFTNNGAQLDISKILFAAVLIGALGGTIDVSISIASALDELAGKARSLSAREMMLSGINIGRDIMGASLNTLILAYVGGSMQILILFYAYNMPLIDIVNTEQISSELMRALAGSFGLLCTVPITSFVCASMMCKNGWHKEDFKIDRPDVLLKKLVKKLKKTEDKKEVKVKKVWKILKGKIHIKRI